MRSIYLVAILATLSLGLPLALGDSCIPTCNVLSHTTAGFIPRLTEVDSGSTVTWETLDGVHTATDRVDFCFNADFNTGSPGSATFVIEGGKLFASSEAGEHVECPAATSLGGAVFVLEYECILHPNTMRANLLVK